MEHVINIGGKERRLVYTPESRRLVERMYPRSDGTPGRLMELVRNHCNPESPEGGSLDVQIAVLWAGLRAETPGLQPSTVEKWVDKPGVRIWEFIVPAVLALMQSGALGFVIEAKKPDEDAEGNAPAPTPE
jgi:hypothetical protein